MKVVKALPFLAMGTLTLGLVGATVLAPVASAADQTTSLSQKVSVEVKQELGINTTGVPAEVKSTDGKTVSSTFTVNCNSAKGFKLTLADADADTSLRLGAKADGAEIKTEADITNKVGWNVTAKGANYAIPAKGANGVVLEQTAKAGDATVKADFNFKTDNTVQSGEYSDMVEYSLVANN